MTDDLIEAVARAIGDSADEMHVSQLKLAARAAIRAAAPLILDMAAGVVERQKFHLHHEDVGYMGDPPEPYNDGCDEAAAAIRQLKERFQ